MRNPISIALILALAGVACGDDDGGPNPIDGGVTDGGVVDGATIDGAQLDGLTPDAMVAPSIDELLEGITMVETDDGMAPSVAWADLDAAIRDGLQTHATNYRGTFATEWSESGLAAKEAFMTGEATPAMNANFDAFVAAVFQSVLPEDFTATSDLPDSFQNVMRKLYLANYALLRGALFWQNFVVGEGADATVPAWNGEGSVGGLMIFDDATIADIKEYGAGVLAELEAIEREGLSDTETRLLDAAIFNARSAAAGNSGSIWGGHDGSTPHGILAWSGDHAYLFTEGNGNIYGGDLEGLLEDVNSWFMPDMRWVNEGTVAGANFLWGAVAPPGSVSFLIPAEDDPNFAAMSRVVEQYGILAHWWYERLVADADADAPCTVYSDDERSEILRGFTANQLIDLEGEFTFESLQAPLQTAADNFTLVYKDAAEAAVLAVFDDETTITNVQRDAVVSAIRAETAFGRIVTTITEALEMETGSTDASGVFRAELDAVPTLGGYEEGTELTMEDEQTVQGMWQEVREFLIERYANHAIDNYAEILNDAGFTVNTGALTFVSAGEGMTIGLGRSFTKSQLYSVMLHEAHHIINYGADLVVQGSAWEGAALAVEHRVAPLFLRTVLEPKEASLALLLLVERDARLVGLTDATIRVHMRESCEDGPASTEFAISVALGWGMSEEAASEAGARAHWGTQFLGYLMGEAVYLEQFDAAQAALGMEIDPFVAQACRMPVVTDSPADVAALAACIPGI